MMRNISDGVFPTMITPFNSDGTIDYPAVLRLMDYYKRSGAAGIFAICQSSEIFYLSFAERLELLRFIMANKPEGMEILASGNVSDDMDVIVSEAREFISTGIDAYVFIANRFASEDESDDIMLGRIFTAVDRLPPETLFGIYECPYPYKRVLSPYAVKALADSGKFRFIKDTCSEIDLIREKLKAAEGSELKIYNANAATLLESLRAGCAGYSGVMANFHTELYAELCSIHKTDRERAEIISDFIGFASVVEYQYYPVNAKYYLNSIGVDMTTYSRVKPDSGLASSKKKELDELRRLTEYFKRTIDFDEVK